MACWKCPVQCVYTNATDNFDDMWGSWTVIPFQRERFIPFVTVCSGASSNSKTIGNWSVSTYFRPYGFPLHTRVSYLTAEVANTWPLEPTDSTITEATTTIRSVLVENEGVLRVSKAEADLQYTEVQNKWAGVVHQTSYSEKCIYSKKWTESAPLRNNRWFSLQNGSINQLRWEGLQIILMLMFIAAYFEKTPGGSNSMNKKEGSEIILQDLF